MPPKNSESRLLESKGGADRVLTTFMAGISDDRLYDEASERRRQPKNRNLVRASAQVFVDRARVGHLEAPSELNPRKPKTHVPDLPEIAEGPFICS
jgi:hypothetical protein